MNRLNLTSSLDFEASPMTGWTRRHWEEAFLALMKGIVDSASEGGARQQYDRNHNRKLGSHNPSFSFPAWADNPENAISNGHNTIPYWPRFPSASLTDAVGIRMVRSGKIQQVIRPLCWYNDRGPAVEKQV